MEEICRTGTLFQSLSYHDFCSAMMRSKLFLKNMVYSGTSGRLGLGNNSSVPKCRCLGAGSQRLGSEASILAVLSALCGLASRCPGSNTGPFFWGGGGPGVSQRGLLEH